ncbi:MAG: ASPIC/UnbV domain-containing protein [Rhodothermales bacterium]|nr:ASPIC/UnbV domain-containing protein [Rhodothermales bacterium]
MGGAELGDILSPPPALQAGNWGDYDNDGDLDLYLLTYAIPQRRTGTPQANQLLRNNDGNNNRWLVIRCVGVVSTRAGIGAKIRVKATIDGEDIWQSRYVSGGATSFVFHGDQRAHFGMGSSVQADSVVIEWPSGIVQTLENIASDQIMTVEEAVPPSFLRANFYADPTHATGTSSRTVQFTDATLADENTPVVSWEWDFDDDGTTDATVPNPEWTYVATSDTAFSVRLTVHNADTSSTLLREAYITLDDVATEISEGPVLPGAFELEQNYPNPFSLTTTLHIRVPYASDIEIGVYDLVGRRIRALFNGFVQPGRHSITWDGRDDQGSPASSGVYLISLRTDGPRDLVNRLLLVR